MTAARGHFKIKPGIRITLGLLALLFGLPSLLTIREYRRHQRDSALIAAIKKNDTAAARVLLNAGADANTLDAPPKSYSLSRLLTDCWQTLDGTPSPPPSTPRCNPVLFLLLP